MVLIKIVSLVGRFLQIWHLISRCSHSLSFQNASSAATNGVFAQGGGKYRSDAL
jgi:hypothetical protein